MYQVRAKVMRTHCGAYMGYTSALSVSGGFSKSIAWRAGPVVSSFGQAMRHAKLRKAELLQRKATELTA